MNRKEKFIKREAHMLKTAEELMLESFYSEITLDMIAQASDVAKGTLYNHFSGKDEMFLIILAQYEQQLLSMCKDDKTDIEVLSAVILESLRNPQKTILFHQTEEFISSTSRGLNKRFSELYELRRARIKILINATEGYIKSNNSFMSTRDFLATMWSICLGGANLLNSSFYQRYMGNRETLIKELYLVIMEMPLKYTKAVSKSKTKTQPKRVIPSHPPAQRAEMS